MFNQVRIKKYLKIKRQDPTQVKDHESELIESSTIWGSRIEHKVQKKKMVKSLAFMPGEHD